MNIKVIKNEADYEESMNEIERLMDLNPPKDSVEGEKLQLLITLVQDYESKLFPTTLPDPIDAIKFRMEQQGLKSKDLIPYIGSRSKVSEVLSRKRPLTLAMIRALQKGLELPAKVLLNETEIVKGHDEVVWSRFPINEMRKRNYIFIDESGPVDIDYQMKSFFLTLGSPNDFLAFLRKAHHIRSLRSFDKQALIAWAGYIVNKAKETNYPTKYKEGVINLSVMREVAKLSRNPDGPSLVKEFLNKYGIGFAVEQHFPQTYLDAALILTDKDHPVIGMTLKQNRLDNFWFSLMHELAHLSLHYKANINLFYDDLEESDSHNIEEDADNLAREALVPTDIWNTSPAKHLMTYEAAEDLANELGVHISIIAGKMRYEGAKYRYLNNLVGQGEVRKYFPNVVWRE